MSPHFSVYRRGTHGVALVIVLAFVVLLSGLVLAFFSRALSERLISNSSANAVRVDIFAQDAVATTLGDLRQEITAGSTLLTPNPVPNPAVYAYKPKAAAAAVPCPVGIATADLPKMPNLVKRSAYDYTNGRPYPFYANPTALPSPSPAPSPYDTTNYPPSARAAKSSSISSSLNGRTISPARWNKALLLPKKDPSLTNDSDFTPVGATAPKNGAAAVWSLAPDWIVVARDGTNPSTWSTALANNGSNPVLGRYAYNIYNEGGLLDMNAAGYPDVSDLASIPQGRDPGYKSSLAFADLTQLPGFAASATDTAGNTIPGINANNGARAQQVIKTLVGWRNYASTGVDLTATTPTAGSPVSGSVNVSPGYSWTGGTRPGSNELNYLNMLRLSNLGFLSPASRLVVNKQSDRAFASRQQLMNLLLNSIADQTSGGTAERAALQNSLQYLGTFSRSLNQPSYFPVSRKFDLKTNYFPRPLILVSSNITDPTRGGGNNVGDGYITASQQDDFNPNFLTLRAQSTFTRNDGTTPAVTGEPLVKTRFALQRLAWLTYLGPSATRNIPTVDPGVDNRDYDMWQLVNNYGIPRDYLTKQGTPDNIKRYFGLEWDGSKGRWKYDLHNSNGAPAGNVSGATGAIRKLPDIAALKTREPDFFELLKASVDPGALGKASVFSQTTDLTEGTNYALAPMNFQFYRDIAYDAAIIQLGANIIDQFDADGYPTRIYFDDGGGRPPREIRGVENLPYIYRVRTGILRVREPYPEGYAGKKNAGSTDYDNDGCTPDLHSGTVPAASGYTANPLKDTGVGVLLAVPDVWNPHDQNSSLGSPRPGATAGNQFRVIATSATPDMIMQYSISSTSTVYNKLTVGGYVVSATNKGRYKGSSYDAPGNGGGGAVTPGTTSPPAAPIPIFSRTPTKDGSAGTPMSGSNFGYNNPQIICSFPDGGSAAATSSYLSFSAPNAALFREPTLLGTPNTTTGSGLTMSITNADVTQLVGENGVSAWTGGGLKLSAMAPNNNPLSLLTAPSTDQPYIGLYLGAFPLRWVGKRWSNGPYTGPNDDTYWVYTDDYPAVLGGTAKSITYSLQCQDPVSGAWVSYDEKYVNTDTAWQWVPDGLLMDQTRGVFTFADPRTSRFGAPDEQFPSFDNNSTADSPHTHAPTKATWLDSANGVFTTERPDIHAGFGGNFRGTYKGSVDWANWAAAGWHYQNIYGGGVNAMFYETGLLAQNNPAYRSDGVRYQGDTPGVGGMDPEFYTDPDGVVRRGTAGFVTAITNASSSPIAAGQPLATATTGYTAGNPTPTLQSASRPKMLNRPFRSVAELGYVFSGTPWKNLDFSTPESAYSELLDVFCVNENDDPSGLVAGKVDLNTRQTPVLTAVLANTSVYDTGAGATPPSLGATDAAAVAKLLVQRTTVGPPKATSIPQPLTNLGDLVGRWTNKVTLSGSFTPALYTSHNIDGSSSYDGFGADLTAGLAASNPVASPVAAQRETVARALSSVGNTRVWNLLIDVIAQTGRYPSSASSLDNFSVEGEQRCWLHVAIDRATGQVVDSKLEIVKE